MTLRPSTAPQRVPLPSPHASSLPALADPESDSLRVASPTVTRLLAAVVTDPLFESTAASALVVELVDFAAHCRLDYPASLVAESESAFVCPPSVRDSDALDILTPHSYAEAIEGPRSLPPLPPSPAPPCLPCVKGRQRAAPHSSSFPPTTASLQTLHMDVWGPARVSGQSRERYFLLVVDDYTRYTTVFPLRSKGEVVDVLIPWICTVRLQLRERFGQDLAVLRLHSDKRGEFSSTLLRDFCRGEGILQPFMLPESPQQNGIAERHIGLVMEVARTSMIHVAAPHFLWPFAVRYAAHQLNLWPRVSLPETSATLRWTGEVGDASVFR
ncbi:unnamed protein product, partial [Closterium sp. NIES-54]